MNKNVIEIYEPQNNTSNSEVFDFFTGSFLWDGRRKKNLAEAEARLQEAQAKSEAEVIKAQAELEKARAERTKGMLGNIAKIGFLMLLVIIAIIVLKK
ncbi:MAG: hypothetical protein PHP31_07585 [Lentimicrobiaceae bacterium]|nr:hypothetical protein [Lentimicrobiaceae bacterium]